MKPRQPDENQSKVRSRYNRRPKTAIRTKVQILWTVRQSSLLTKLSFNIVREICGYFELTKFLPWIHGKFFQVYDLPHGDSVQVTISHPVTYGSVYCEVDEETVICLGGKPAQRVAYFLSLFDYKLTEVESMRTPRCNPGLISYQRCVYVFGGGTGSSSILTSCEKFNTSLGTWTDLSSMQYPRYYFTPSIYEAAVYLPECREHRVMERFNLLTEQFTTLSIELPQVSAFVSFIICGEFFIVSSNEVWRWKVISYLSSSRNTETRDREEIVSPCPPVVVERKAYWVRSDTGELVTFDLDQN